MLTVYKFGAAFGLPDSSPFVVKLETWLRMTGIPYRTEPGEMRKAPKGKLPYIADGGRMLGDSSFIIDHLKSKFGDRLNDARFDAHTKATARVLKSMFESELYFVIVYLRWWNDDDYEILRPAIAESIKNLGVPSFAANTLAGVARRKVRGQLEAQGIGRHAREEIFGIGRSLVEAASDLLEDKPFFLDEAPSTLDATAYGMLASILFAPFESPVKACVESRANLVRYCERIRSAHWAGGTVG